MKFGLSDEQKMLVGTVRRFVSDELQSLEDGVEFDYDGDGNQEQTAWIGKNEAFLVHDANADRIVNDGSEIAFADIHPDATTDLEGLVLVFDTNQDGVFDVSDTLFGEFGIWQDLNSDGITDLGDFLSQIQTMVPVLADKDAQIDTLNESILYLRASDHDEDGDGDGEDLNNFSQLFENDAIDMDNDFD